MLSDGQEPEAPAYYVLGRHVRDADAILAALRLTPVDTAIVSDVLDYDFARSVFAAVILTEKGKEQATLANVGPPCVIFGEAEFLDAVYPDGRRESLAFQA